MEEEEEGQLVSLETEPGAPTASPLERGGLERARGTLVSWQGRGHFNGLLSPLWAAQGTAPAEASRACLIAKVNAQERHCFIRHLGVKELKGSSHRITPC